MFELSLHILDLVQNAIAAGATLIGIGIAVDHAAGTLTITIGDDGRGMDAALLEQAASPFGTTRTSRKVGLGIPMFEQLAEQCSGALTLESEPGAGTRLTARFALDSIDLPPMGDLPGTMRALILGAPDATDFTLSYRVDARAFAFDTREVRAQLGGVPLGEPDVLNWIGEYIGEGLAQLS